MPRSARELMAVSPPRPSSSERHHCSPVSAEQARQAFCAAEAASAATKAVIGTSSVLQHVSKLVASDSLSCERTAAAHRLNERFAACSKYDEACELARELLRTPSLCDSLVSLLVDGDALPDVAVQLLHSVSLPEEGAQAVLRSGAVSVVAAAMRAEDPLVRAHGLALLCRLSEAPGLASGLVRAGVVRLLCALGRRHDESSAAQIWPPLLHIADALLRDPRQVPERQRVDLRDTLTTAARAYKAGVLPLSTADARTMNRLMIHLRAINLAHSAHKPHTDHTKPPH